MIQVTIEVEHGDGVIEIKRDSHYTGVGASTSETLKKIVAAAEASAIAALKARAER